LVLFFHIVRLVAFVLPPMAIDLKQNRFSLAFVFDYHTHFLEGTGRDLQMITVIALKFSLDHFGSY
jgi:hypothetical protein